MQEYDYYVNTNQVAKDSRLPLVHSQIHLMHSLFQINCWIRGGWEKKHKKNANLGPASGVPSGSQRNDLEDSNASDTGLAEGSCLLETSERGGNFSLGESVRSAWTRHTDRVPFTAGNASKSVTNNKQNEENFYSYHQLFM